MREENYRYRDIGVVARDASKYESLISEVFTEAGIPFFIDSKKKLLYHPLLELVNAALEVVGDGWHYHTVFRFLKSGLLPVSLEEIDQLENYCLAAGIRPYHWLSEAAWSFWPLTLAEKAPDVEAKAAELAVINDIRRRAIKALASFDRSLAGENTVSGMIARIRKLLEDIQAGNTLEKWAQTALIKGDSEEAALHRQAIQGLEGLFLEAEAYLGEAELPLESLRSILQGGNGGIVSLSDPGWDWIRCLLLLLREAAVRNGVLVLFLISIWVNSRPRSIAQVSFPRVREQSSKSPD